MTEYKKKWISRRQGEFLEIGYVEYESGAPSIVMNMTYHDGRTSYPLKNSNVIGQTLEYVLSSHKVGGWE